MESGRTTVPGAVQRGVGGGGDAQHVYGDDGVHSREAAETTGQERRGKEERRTGERRRESQHR